jgi:hypothetical protein
VEFYQIFVGFKSDFIVDENLSHSLWQCCGSWFIPDPDFYPSRIPDPTTAKKEKLGKVVVLHFSVATNITNLKSILFLDWLRKKKFGPIYKEF